MNQLASHFQSKANEARMARVWSAVEEKLDRVESRRRYRPVALVLSASAVVCIVFAGVYLGYPWRHQSAALEVLALADGSRVEHSTNDPIEIVAMTPDRVELRMTRGRALFRVTPNRNRVFLTRAADVTVRVVGTEYAVDLRSAGVRVDVTKGQVEVQRNGNGDRWRVVAGNTWSSLAPPAARVAVDTSDPALTPATPDREAVPTSTRPTSERTAKASVTASISVAKKNDAAALFGSAQEARAAGRVDQAAALLAELLERFPHDSRAGLAAFELGRIRLASGDAKGALDAFDQAAGASNMFDEQVDARRIQALEQIGDLAVCRTARKSFLRRFPNGAFAAVVRRRCP